MNNFITSAKYFKLQLEYYTLFNCHLVEKLLANRHSTRRKSRSAVSFSAQSSTNSDFVPPAPRAATAAWLLVQIVICSFTSLFLGKAWENLRKFREFWGKLRMPQGARGVNLTKFFCRTQNSCSILRRIRTTPFSPFFRSSTRIIFGEKRTRVILQAWRQAYTKRFSCLECVDFWDKFKIWRRKCQRTDFFPFVCTTCYLSN